MKNLYRNLKIRPLNFATSFYQQLYKINNLRYEVETTPIFNKPNWYLLNGKSWIEVEINGVFKAFEQNPEQFLFSLNKDDLYKIPKKEIELLLKLQKLNPKIISPKQNTILFKIKCFNENKEMFRRARIQRIKILKEIEKNS